MVEIIHVCVCVKNQGRMSIAIIPHHPNNQNASFGFPPLFSQPAPIHGRLAEFLGWNKAGLHVLRGRGSVELAKSFPSWTIFHQPRFPPFLATLRYGEIAIIWPQLYHIMLKTCLFCYFPILKLLLFWSFLVFSTWFEADLAGSHSILLLFMSFQVSILRTQGCVALKNNVVIPNWLTDQLTN